MRTSRSRQGIPTTQALAGAGRAATRLLAGVAHAQHASLGETPTYLHALPPCAPPAPPPPPPPQIKRREEPGLPPTERSVGRLGLAAAAVGADLVRLWRNLRDRAGEVRVPALATLAVPCLLTPAFASLQALKGCILGPFAHARDADWVCTLTCFGWA
jgi:hypothetical protein